MSKSGNSKFWRRRSRSSALTTILSIAGVLFFLGFIIGGSIWGLDILKQVEENLIMEVFLHDYTSEDQKSQLANKLDSMQIVNSMEYLSKEAASERMAEIVGEEVKNSLGGVNPYWASFQIKLVPELLEGTALSKLKEELNKMPFVADVIYQGDQLPQLKKNLTSISWALLILGVGLSLLGVALINATIRLSIYAKRLSIRSMELVGATRAFIRRPFLWRGVLQGMTGGLLAVVLLTATFYGIFFLLRRMDVIQGNPEAGSWIVLFGGIVLFGSVIGFIGSYWALNKYLNRNLDELL
ncbi:MAG: permease-like cell division protein FtsX [Bacteroidia bacterium]|nr:permease-like cell division protein FtsX [Bacteroidia bacterium]